MALIGGPPCEVQNFILWLKACTYGISGHIINPILVGFRWAKWNQIDICTISWSQSLCAQTSKCNTSGIIFDYESIQHYALFNGLWMKSKRVFDWCRQSQASEKVLRCIRCGADKNLRNCLLFTCLVSGIISRCRVFGASSASWACQLDTLTLIL